MDADGSRPCRPWCCCTLEKGSEIVAILDIVVSFFEFVWIIFSVFFKHMVFEGAIKPETPPWGGLLIATVLLIIQIILAVFLFMGAKHRNYKNLVKWLFTTVVVVFANFAATFAGNSPSKTPGEGWAMSALFTLMWRCYMLSVVYAFMRELSPDDDDVENQGGGLPFMNAVAPAPGGTPTDVQKVDEPKPEAAAPEAAVPAS